MTTYRVPQRLAYVESVDGDGPCVFLMLVPDGSPVVLHGTAAVIWVLAADGEDDVADAVARVVGAARGDVARDVGPYVEGLLERGLLEVNHPSGEPHMP